MDKEWVDVFVPKCQCGSYTFHKECFDEEKRMINEIKNRAERLIQKFDDMKPRYTHASGVSEPDLGCFIGVGWADCDEVIKFACDALTLAKKQAEALREAREVVKEFAGWECPSCADRVHQDDAEAWLTRWKDLEEK